MFRSPVWSNLQQPYMKAERFLITAVSLLFLLLVAAAASPALAQTETFDLASFTPPAGWKVSQNQTAITYTAIDQATPTYCMFGVYACTPSSGDPIRDFAGEWESIVRHGFVAGAAPTPAAGRIASGLTYLEGGANVRQQGASSYAHLMVFSAGAHNFSVLIVATDRAALGRRQATIQAFLDSLRVTAQPGSVPGRAMPAPKEPSTVGRPLSPATRLTL